MGKHLLTVHGHKLTCADDRAYHGIKHLAYGMEKEAVKELYEQVERGEPVDFDDDEHRGFTLIDGENGAFTVVARDKQDGWF